MGANMRVNWTGDEIKYLYESWNNLSLNDVINYLGRSEDSIIRKARRLGLNVCKMENELIKKKWSAQEDQLIREKYKVLSPAEISNLLNRSVYAIKKRAAILGVTTKVSRWTEKEEEFLKEKWGIANIDTIARNINRSRNSVLLKAYQISLRDQVSANGLYFTPAEISEILNVNIRTLYTWMESGLLRYKKFRVGKKIKYQISVDNFCEFIEKNQNKWNACEADIELIRSYYVSYALLDEGNLAIKEESTQWLEEKVTRDKQEFKKLMRPWTTKEEQELISMFVEGFTSREICSKLGRTKASTKTKIYILKKKVDPRFCQTLL
jgi:Response regulator containing a CheY-like receiver domain and an HTH DNA-binding domain